MADDSIVSIVLNWNGGVDTLNCVRSLLASQDVKNDLLVVDNGSSNGSDIVLRETFPQLNLLKNGRNLGVAKAWNTGVRWAVDRGSRYIFFLNDDAVVSTTCLTTLARTLVENPQAGMVTPRILDGSNSGRIWFDGGFFNLFGDTVHHNLGGEPVTGRESFEEDFATGCAMLVRVEVFKVAGLFDELYFAYSEDADMCLRAKACGFTVMHNPSAVATHYPSAATIRNKGKWFRDYYVTRNKLLLVSKHQQGLRWIVFLLYFSCRYVAAPIAYFTITGQFRRVAAVVAGVRDFLGGKFGKRYE